MLSNKAPNSNVLGRRLIQVDSFGSSEDIQSYNTPEGTSLLYIWLWGAGGGGGGSHTTGSQFACAGGGGAGGFVSGCIQHPLKPVYKFFVAPGGSGGIGLQPGSSSERSWFSNPAHLCAFGGNGGMTTNVSNATLQIAQAGAGNSGTEIFTHSISKGTQGNRDTYFLDGSGAMGFGGEAVLQH